MSFNLNYSVMTNPSPCSKNCQKRSPSCHCTCEDYKTWKEELDTRREAIRKQKDMDNLYRMHREDVFHKIAKRNKKY